MSNKRYNFTATPAARTRIYLRAGICGAGGSGKSYSGMAIASALRDRLGCGPLYVIDTENGSALRYAKSTKTGRGFDFMHVPMPDDDYSPAAYMAALDFCESKGAGVILVDSVSHEYDGPGGILEIVDRNANGRDNFAGWRVATPMHKRFIQRLCSVQAHLVCTVRAKVAYTVREKTDANGKTKKSFEKDGLGPIQREGFEYEMDTFFWMENAVLTVDKTRCDRLEPLSTWERPGAEFAGLLADWIEDTEPSAPQEQQTTLEDVIDKAVAAGIAAGIAADHEHAKSILDTMRKWMRTNRIAEQQAASFVVQWRERVRKGIEEAKAAAQPAQAEPVSDEVGP